MRETVMRLIKFSRFVIPDNRPCSESDIAKTTLTAL